MPSVLVQIFTFVLRGTEWRKILTVIPTTGIAAAWGIPEHDTMCCCYDAVSLLQNHLYRHPIAHPWGWDKGAFCEINADYCSASVTAVTICNVISYWTMLQWHLPVCYHWTMYTYCTYTSNCSIKIILESELTLGGLVPPYGIIEHSQHWFR